MAEIRKTLEALADSIEEIQNRPAPSIKINDRELSGNKINGGRITNFSSAGIKDEARDFVLKIKDDGIHVDAVYTKNIPNALSVGGDLKVNGEIFAQKLSVNEISADVRHERTSPLEFKGDSKPAYGKGLVWTGGSYTKQLMLQSNPDRLWSTEHFDLAAEKEYRISNIAVLTENALGNSVVNSNLKKVGTLNNLRVAGDLTVDEFFKYSSDTQRLSLGAEEASGMLTLGSFDHQFIVDPTLGRQWKVGTYTTSELQIVTDDTPRITIGANGNLTFHNKTVIQNRLGIGVKNFAEDADLTVAGPIRFQNKKFESGEAAPTSGVYVLGDIVWNSKPQPTGYVGWVCIREGAPGMWKGFGQIAN